MNNKENRKMGFYWCKVMYGLAFKPDKPMVWNIFYWYPGGIFEVGTQGFWVKMGESLENRYLDTCFIEIDENIITRL